MTGLDPGVVVDATALPLAPEPVPAAQTVTGSPTTALRPLGTVSAGVEVGVWEMTPGTMTDVEGDEVFIVVAGHARVRFTWPELPPIEVGPGSVVRLTAGMRTEWTVTETLRKVYLA